MQMKLLGIISVISQNNWNINGQCIRDVYDSVRMEVSHNILNEFGMPMKPVRLMCLN